jgi:nucleoside-diphosphate-sugar epimerase
VRKRAGPVLLRMTADALLASVALAAGLAIRFPPPAGLWRNFAAPYGLDLLLLAALVIGSNAFCGLYYRTRFYTRRSKVLALAQSISLAYAALVCVLPFTSPPARSLPGTALVLSYLFTLATVGGSRLGRDYFRRRFTLELQERRPGRAVRRVLVVGGAGYIGSGLVRDLLADGYRVRVLDSLACGDEALRPLYGCPDFELVQGDFCHVGPVVQATKGVDAVLHLGAIVGDPACAVDEDETLETNLAATRLLAEVSRAAGVSRLLFASTCSVYGACDHLVDERSPLHPVSLYAATKIDSERVLLAKRDSRFHPVILRLGTAFGWSLRPRFDLVVNLLAARAAVEGQIQIFNGGQWRPFIHVADISRAFRAVLAAPLAVTSGQIFNTGSNSLNLTLRQLASEIASLVPGLEVAYLPGADTRNYRVSFDKIRDRLGFECQMGIEAGVREILTAFDRGQVADFRDPRYSNVQLIERRRRERSGPPAGPPAIELTALQFARKSRWWRSVALGASGASLLQDPASDLLHLARMVEPAKVSAMAAAWGRDSL